MIDSIPLRTCKQCRKEYPFTTEYFYRSNGKFLDTYCKTCRSERHLRKLHGDEKYERLQKERQEKQALLEKGLRRCIYGDNCKHPDGPVLPATSDYFEPTPKSHTRDGMRAYCRACRNHKYRERDIKNYHLKKDDPDFKLKRNVRNHKTISRRKNIPCDFTTEDWERCLEYWHHRCCICDRPIGLWHTLAQEHWIPTTDPRPDNPGTVPWNMLPMCHSKANGRNGCNNSKSDLDPLVWLERKLGKRKAKKKMLEIEAYFATLRK